MEQVPATRSQDSSATKDLYMNRFASAIFVLTVAAAAYATTCLDAYRYADMGVHSYIQVYDAYVDSHPLKSRPARITVGKN